MKEKLLFNLIKNNFVPDLESTDEFNPTDGISKEKDLAIELKCRNTYYRFLLLEKKKYNKLIEHKNCRYINSIVNGENIEIYSWNVKKLKNLNWHWRLMPNTTEFGNISWINKEVAFIDIKLAKNLTNVLLNKNN